MWHATTHVYYRKPACIPWSNTIPKRGEAAQRPTTTCVPGADTPGEREGERERERGREREREKERERE